MHGRLILHNRPKGFQRIDVALWAERVLALFVVLLTLSATSWLIQRASYDAAVTLFVFAMGISTVFLTTIQSRHSQVTEYAQRTLLAVQERWDELRNDGELLECLTRSAPISDLKPHLRLKLRLYLASFLDAQALIIHYIRRGYYRHTQEFARVYEAMIRSLFEYPYFADIWQNKGDWGRGRIRDEYGRDLVYVVDHIIEAIRTESERAAQL